MNYKYIPRIFEDYNKQNFIKRYFIKKIIKYWRNNFNLSKENRQGKLFESINRKLDTIYFNYIEAPEIKNDELYLNFVNHSLRELKYGYYTIPGIIIKPEENVTSTIDIKKGLVILGGIAILGKFVKNVSDYQLTIGINIKNELDINNSYKFTIPINRSKTLLKSIGTYFRIQDKY